MGFFYQVYWHFSETNNRPLPKVYKIPTSDSGAATAGADWSGLVAYRAAEAWGGPPISGGEGRANRAAQPRHTRICLAAHIGA